MNEPDIEIKLDKYANINITRFFDEPLTQNMGYKSIKIIDENDKIILFKRNENWNKSKVELK